jgi:colanic acid/amylovoran biosynthesis glycosyltransferase
VSAPRSAPVLYVLPRFPLPSETVVLREMRGLEALGGRVLIDSLLPPEEEPPDRLQAPVRLLPCHPRLRRPQIARAHLRIAVRTPARWFALAGRAAGDPEAWRRFLQSGLVAERMRREGVVHVHAPVATAAAAVARDAGALAGVPVTEYAEDVVHEDDAPLSACPRRGGRVVVTLTEQGAADLQRALPGTPVRVVRHGPAPSPPHGATIARPLLCAARLVPGNGIDTLVTAVGMLADDRPALHLEIIGDGPLDAALRGQAFALGLEDRVHFRGPLPSADVQAALYRCAMLVLPGSVDASGDRDGVPTVVLEAMACATPVVTTRVVGLPELLRTDPAGLLAAPDDPAGLAVAIATLLDDPARAARLGASGRRLVTQLRDRESRSPAGCSASGRRSPDEGRRRPQ